MSRPISGLLRSDYDWLALLAAIVIVLLLLLASGCAAVEGSRSERLQDATIVALQKVTDVAQHQVAPALPPPYNAMLEGAGVMATAGLGLWLKRVHSKVNKVSNNHAPQPTTKTG